MLKLANKTINGVSVSEMKDGDVAVIVGWGNGVTYVGSVVYAGRVVQRYGNNLITLGANEGKSWSNFFDCILSPDENRVRILEKGETLVVE
jgi:hypothetical protein